MRGDLDLDAALWRFPLGRGDNLEALAVETCRAITLAPVVRRASISRSETKDLALGWPAFSKGQKIRASRSVQPGK